MIMMSNVKDLTETCSKSISDNRLNFVWWSFRNNFDDIHELISDDFKKSGLNNDGWKHFIKICDNRLECSKAFSGEIACVLGFDFVALTVLASITESGKGDPILSPLLNNEYPFFRVMVISAFVFLIVLFILLCHYRTQIHGWTAFKEQAMMQQYELNENRLVQA